MDRKICFLHCLDRGLTQVVIDPSFPFVSVPKNYTKEKQLSLNFSKRFKLPRFDITDWGIVAELSFSGKGHVVRIPWNAITEIRFNKEVYRFKEEDPPAIPSPIPDNLPEGTVVVLADFRQNKYVN